ncbi:MAG: MaoC family dehydratase N-terminal domain-containing protein [Pirellulaceae bacterium]|nr:MaoC family dehydratase N-terminal domain-containing protein [Pirellulaceae bacterium]
MSEPLEFEQLQVGQRWTSQGRTITETDVVMFAGISGDYNPLHVDHEFARQTPFGRPIAHGLLGLSLVAGLGSHSPNVATQAFLGIRCWDFLKPAYIGDTVHVVTEVMAKTPKSRRRGHVVWKRDLVNQQGEVIQSGMFETLVATALGNRTARPAAAEEQAVSYPTHPAVRKLAQ